MKRNKSITPPAIKPGRLLQNGEAVRLDPPSSNRRTGLNGELGIAIQRYIDLYEFAPISYVSFNRTGRIEEVNLEATTLLGRSRQRLIGSPFAVCVARKDMPLFLRHLLNCRVLDTRVETELHLNRADGERLNVLLSSTSTYSSMKDGALLYQTAIIDLTESKRAEEAIRRSEQRYRTLFDLVPVAVYTCDANGKIEEFNRRAAELWGREPNCDDGENDKFCGSYKIYYPDGRFMPHKDCPMARALRGEKLQAKDLEIVVERRNGQRRDVVVAPRTLTNDQGEITGAINCLFDITERRRTQERLAEHTRLLDLSNDAILVRDRKGCIIYWSQGATAMYGYRPEEALGRITHKLLRTEHPEGVKLICKKLERDDRWRGELLHTRKDGTKIVVMSRWALDRDEEGKPGSILETNTDITQRKRAEEKIRNSEELHRAMITQTAAGIVRTDLKGTFTFVNRKFCELLGYKRHELIGKKIVEITHPDDVGESKKLFKRVVGNAEPYDLEKRYSRKDGSTLWVNVSASPMLDAAGKPQSVAVVVVDISAWKRTKAALQRSKDLLEERVRSRTGELRKANEELENEIKRRKGLEGQILEISDREQQRLGQELHDDLCQQLTAIGFMARATALRLKNHRVAQVGDLEKIAQLINDSVATARSIAHDLHKEEVDAAGFVDALRALTDRKIWNTPCRLELKTELNFDDNKVASTLYRILREALTNANKHASATQIVVEVGRKQKNLVFSVTDNGVGFGAKTKHQPGLGFRIMQYRAQSIGARLALQSPPGGGARILCSLPQPK